MDWKGANRSDNVEDRRGLGRPAALGGGATIIVFVIAMFLGVDPGQLMGLLEQGQAANQTNTKGSAQVKNPAEEEIFQLSRAVLASTEAAWQTEFRANNANYKQPTLVVFSDSVQSACGFAQSATGPFYCPSDQKLYLDLSFLHDLNKLGAPGEFAFAYVIAHEVGHHVSNIIGVLPKAQEIMQQSPKVKANEISVKLELQADCFAGVWVSKASQSGIRLEPKDIEEGLRAAGAVGDDRLMKSAGRSVNPESFTHGSSAQRMKWFKVGFDGKSMKACNTFAS